MPLAPLPAILIEPIVREALLEDLGRAGDLTTDAIPAHAEDDYFAIEMAAFEEFVHVEHSSTRSFEQSAGKLCGVNPVRTRANLGPVRGQWLGFRPSLPDSLPVIGRSRHCGNLSMRSGTVTSG
jgi:hypothetical protein